MRTITLEEHFVTENFLKATGGDQSDSPAAFQPTQAKLLDLGAERIADMDEAGIDVQVLSLAANGFDTLDAADATALARDVNDELASTIQTYPARFAGFATLALKDPNSAAKELERSIRELGFKGAYVNGTTDGEFLDQPKFLPVLEAAEALDVPIYLHPAFAPKAVEEAYYSDLPGQAGFLLSIAGWGWHSETALHTLRLIVSGVFDRLPNLKLIIGHMGEGLPFALARSDSVLASAMKGFPLGVAETFRRNVHLTTSGYFTVPPFQCALDVAGIDRLMFSVDYPFSPSTKGRDFLTSLSLSGEDLAKLSYGNAEKLLKL